MGTFGAYLRIWVLRRITLEKIWAPKICMFGQLHYLQIWGFCDVITKHVEFTEAMQTKANAKKEG